MLALAVALALLAAAPTKQFGPRLDVIANAAKVEAQRLTGEQRSGCAGFDCWVTRGDPVVLSAALADRARKLVSSPSTWSNIKPSQKKCEGSIRPGLLLRFTRGKDRAELVFCFDCGDARLDTGEEGFVQVDFEPGAPAMLKLTRDIFPNDADLKNALRQAAEYPPRPPERTGDRPSNGRE